MSDKPAKKAGSAKAAAPRKKAAAPTVRPAGDEELDRLDAGLERRIAEILALAGEEACLVALLLPLQRADELELRVVLRADHAASQSIQLP